MRFRLSTLRRASLILWAAAPVVVAAQQGPPAEPPQPMPSDTPTLRITTKEVLVPTLVEKGDGGIVYGLKGGDFVVEDNGAPQKVHVQEEMDTAPVSLVVAVEQGGMSVLEFDKVAKLGPLLDLFLSDARSEAALVGFDSEPHLIRDFGHSGEDMNQAVSISGQAYTSSPNAFKFRSEFNPTCACKAAGQTWSDALKNIDDKAAAQQQGDIIVTDESAKKMAQPPSKSNTGSGKKGATTATAPDPAVPNAPVASDASSDNKQIRTVGPTFIPAR